MNPLESKLEKYIQAKQLVTPKQSVLLAVSGGIDSMVMLHLFSKLYGRKNLHLSVIHVNHQLRGEESMEDERFVRKISADYNIPFYCERVNVLSYAHELKFSKQLAARRLRYECFERVRTQIGANVVATAHHADDNAETVLLNILRGTGIRGLSGIPPKRKLGNIIRPLLFATRTEIDVYATKFGIKYRNDSSNKSLIYRRNELRHRIIPVLKKRNPKIVKILNCVADKMQSVNERMHKLVDKALHSYIRTDELGRLILDVKKLKAEPDFLWDEIFVEILNRLQIEPTGKNVGALHRLCTLPTGRMVELSGVLSAFRNRDHIIFQATNDTQPNVQRVKCGNSYDYKGCIVSISYPEAVPAAYTGTHDVEYIDAECLGTKLVLRSWHAGDWFIPLGMKTKKKLSDYFTDQKVPRYLKTAIPVLESDGSIVWVCGKRLDDRFKLTARTRTAIRLSCHQKI